MFANKEKKSNTKQFVKKKLTKITLNCKSSFEFFNEMSLFRMGHASKGFDSVLNKHFQRSKDIVKAIYYTSKIFYLLDLSENLKKFEYFRTLFQFPSRKKIHESSVKMRKTS